MAATSTRKVTITLSSDVVATHVISAASNTASPASVEIRTLSSGANTITLPTGGSTVTAVTVVPPSGNTANITIKGVTGDTGVQMHDTDPFTLSFDSSVTSFVITAGDAITGIRLFWS